MRTGLGLGLGLGSTPAATFPPTNLANLTVWYSGSNVVLGSGGKVAQWSDRSGHGNHATQPTVANQIPYEAAGINGRPCLHSNAFGQLVFPDLHTLVAGHLFAVIQCDHDPSGPDASGTDGQIWSLGTGANTYHPFSDGFIYESAMTTVRKNGISHGTSLAQPHIYEIISRAGEFSVLINGTQVFTTPTNTFGMPVSAFLLAETSLTGANSRVRMAEFVLCASKQTVSDAAMLRKKYLGPKYAIPTA